MHSGLKRGDRGEYVKKLQNRLNLNGYSCGTADGVFGAKTESALKAYQKEHGLQALGVANYVTLARLFPENIPATPTPAPTATPRPTPTPKPPGMQMFFTGIKNVFSGIGKALLYVSVGLVSIFYVGWGLYTFIGLPLKWMIEHIQYKRRR